MKSREWRDIKRNIILAYDNDADRRVRAKQQQWKKKERRVFLSYLQSEKKRTLLDVGAGTGNDSLYFKKHGLRVTATDISPEHIRYCKKRGLRAILLDMYDLHTLRKKYDAVYSMSSLVHIPKKDMGRILSKIKRILKPRGFFYLGMYGGVDVEGIYQKDHCRPKRFFALYKTPDLLAIVQKYFKLEYFKSLVPFKDGIFQSMILRRK
jgi:cyclopropane fatty-acyl-phospholipid synthase-like methyltransferase